MGLGNMKVAKLLLDHGASFGFGTDHPTLVYASANGYRDLVDLCLDSMPAELLGEIEALSSLTVSALNGHEETARLLLARGVPVQTPTETEMIPLSYAKFKDKIVKIFLDHGVDLNRALNAVATSGDRQLVARIIAMGADINKVTVEQRPINKIFDLEKVEQADMLQLLLNAGSLIHRPELALFLERAAQLGAMDLVKILLQKLEHPISLTFSSMNVLKYKYGYNATTILTVRDIGRATGRLHEADALLQQAGPRVLDIARLLEQKRDAGDIHLVHSTPEACLTTAVHTGKLEQVNFILRCYGDRCVSADSFDVAWIHQDAPMLERLYQCNHPITPTAAFEETMSNALGLAAHRGYMPLVEMAQRKGGGFPDECYFSMEIIQDGYGKPIGRECPSMQAPLAVSGTIFHFLAHHGFLKGVSTSLGWMQILYNAISVDAAETVEEFFRGDVNVNAQNVDNALMRAVKYGAYDVVRLLLSKGINLKLCLRRYKGLQGLRDLEPEIGRTNVRQRKSGLIARLIEKALRERGGELAEKYLEKN